MSVTLGANVTTLITSTHSHPNALSCCPVNKSLATTLEYYSLVTFNLFFFLLITRRIKYYIWCTVCDA